MILSSSLLVTITTGTFGAISLICDSVSNPVKPGIFSSRKIISGLPISARARCNRLFCPVDNCIYCFFSISLIPRPLSMVSSIFVLFHFANSFTASIGLIWAGKDDDCSWIPIFPFTVIAPLSYFLRPSIHSSVVVFPAPLHPDIMYRYGTTYCLLLGQI